MFHYNLTRTTGTSHADQYTFMIISRSVLLRMKMLQIKFVQKIKPHTLQFNNSFPKNRAVYEIMWKNVVQPDRPQVAIQCGVRSFHAC